MSRKGNGVRTSDPNEKMLEQIRAEKEQLREMVQEAHAIFQNLKDTLKIVATFKRETIMAEIQAELDDAEKAIREGTKESIRVSQETIMQHFVELRTQLFGPPEKEHVTFNMLNIARTLCREIEDVRQEVNLNPDELIIESFIGNVDIGSKDGDPMKKWSVQLHGE